MPPGVSVISPFQAVSKTGGSHGKLFNAEGLSGVVGTPQLCSSLRLKKAATMRPPPQSVLGGAARRSPAFTSHQLGLAVDKLRFPGGRVALTGVMEDLDEGALLPRRAGGPLVEGVVEHQVKLGTVLDTGK